MASLENAKYGLAFSSGMGAITTVLNTLKTGDQVIAMSEIYGGTYKYLKEVLVNFGISTSWADMTNVSFLGDAFTEKTKVVVAIASFLTKFTFSVDSVD